MASDIIFELMGDILIFTFLPVVIAAWLIYRISEKIVAYN